MKIAFGREIKKRKLLRALRRPYYIIKSFNKQKVFCIGLNKTGTTSLERAMNDLGYLVANQREAELLFEDWIVRDFKRLTKYCKSAVFFQDSPFSHPFTFIALDQAFPKSKFILTVRDSPDQWYNSLVRFHSKLWGKGNSPPTSQDLKNAKYIFKGMPYTVNKHIYKTTDEEPYKKEILIDHYKTHIKNVKDYFSFRQNDLLILNVAEDGAYGKLTNFLGKESNRHEFPWENKTNEK